MRHDNKMVKSTKNQEIEHLRAVAIVITLAAHVSFMMPYHSGVLTDILFNYYSAWVGVDLFFCISGYVIAASAAQHFDNARENGHYALAVKQFWTKRCFRLLPSAWLWVLIPMGLSLYFNDSGTFGSFKQNLVSLTAVLSFTGNLANITGLSLGPNGVYWSLALEEQFYFIFPLFLFAITGNDKRLKILLLLIAIQFVIPRNPFGAYPENLIASFRIDGLMWGIALYLFSKTSSYKMLQPKGLATRPVFALLLCFLLIYLLGAIPGQLSNMPITLGLVALLSMILVWLASYQQGLVLDIKGLRNILQWLGSRSYGLYLIHVPVYRFTLEAWTRYCEKNEIALDGSLTAEMLVSAALLMIICAELNYRFVEMPLRNKGRAIAQRMESSS